MNLVYVDLPMPSIPYLGKTREEFLALPLESKKDYTRYVMGGLFSIKGMDRHACCICGEAKSVAHHDSYDEPFRVSFLCHKHHKARHRELGWGIAPRKTEARFKSMVGAKKRAAEMRKAQAAAGPQPKTRTSLAVSLCITPDPELRAGIEQAASSRGQEPADFITDALRRVANSPAAFAALAKTEP